MKIKTKSIILVLISFIFSGCVIYSEKNSEALSSSVYAAKDSLDVSRVDLASDYANQAFRVINPPKNRIQIDPIIENANKKILLPKTYSNEEVIVIGSARYNELIKNKNVSKQLEIDNKNLKNAIAEVDKQLLRDDEITNKMILKINSLNDQLSEKDKQLVKKDLAILRCWVIIGIFVLITGGYIYIKFKGILPV